MSVQLSEAKAQIRLTSPAELESLRIAMTESANRIGSLVEKSKLVKEGVQHLVLERQIIDEAAHYERLMIMEAITDAGFHDMKKQFMSLLNAVGHVVNEFHGSDLADALDNLRSEGLELLNELMEYIVDLDDRYAGKGDRETQLGPNLKKVRNAFVNVFTNLTVIMKGIIVLSTAITQSDGYNDIMGILASLKRAGASETSLLDALRKYDSSLGVKQTVGQQKPGFLAKLFGKAGPKGLLAKFKELIVGALNTKAPGFSKLVDTADLLNFMLRQMSVDRLIKTFQDLDNIVANEVNVEFLLKITQEPKGVWNALKTFFGDIGGGGVGGGSRLGAGRG
jgi:hypothetical protein